MSESLLSYFEQELAFIRQETGEFTRRHPSAAKSLGISDDSIDDPQITRLVDSTALLNARLQERLDDAYPQLTNSLLSLLFPHYLRPLPAFSILQMTPLEDVSAKHFIPKGTHLGITDKESETAVFRSCQDMTLYPFHIDNAQVRIAPFNVDKPAEAKQAKAMLELTLKTSNPAILFSDLDCHSLEVFLRGENQSVLRLYDHLLSGVQQVCMQYGDQRVLLGSQALKAVGFDETHQVLPYSARSFGGFKLLTEFFSFPERFQVIELDLAQSLRYAQTNEITIQIFLDDMSIDLSRSIGIDNFHLFCTPIVNLQTLIAEPLIVNFEQTQYPIVLDAGGGQQLQLFSIDEVSDISSQQSCHVPALYGDKYQKAETGLRWQLVQRWQNGTQLKSSLRVADLEHQSVNDENRTWLISATCSDGELASELSMQSEVTCRDSIALPASLQLLRRPTNQIRIKELDKNSWPLLAHLHFNYHSLFGADNPVSALKEMLNLYNHNENSQNNAYIAAIIALEQEQVVAPVRISGKSCFAHGTRLSITLSTKDLDGGIELLSQLLDRFFAYFAGFNSFTQLVILIEGIEGEYKVFPRRSGCRNML